MLSFVKPTGNDSNSLAFTSSKENRRIYMYKNLLCSQKCFSFSFHINIRRMKLFQAYVPVHRQWKGS